MIHAEATDTMTSADWDVFPPLRSGQIDAARTSSWYPNFRDVTIESLFIDIADIGEEGAFREVRALFYRTEPPTD